MGARGQIMRTLWAFPVACSGALLLAPWFAVALLVRVVRRLITSQTGEELVGDPFLATVRQLLSLISDEDLSWRYWLRFVVVWVDVILAVLLVDYAINAREWFGGSAGLAAAIACVAYPWVLTAPKEFISTVPRLRRAWRSTCWLIDVAAAAITFGILWHDHVTAIGAIIATAAFVGVLDLCVALTTMLPGQPAVVRARVRSSASPA